MKMKLMRSLNCYIEFVNGMSEVQIGIYAEMLK